MRLYELQQELRRLSYFDIWRRMQLSITICKVLLQLPIMINTASREKRQQKTIQDAGILGMRVENALKLAVGLLEAGERYTTWWSSHTHFIYIYTHAVDFSRILPLCSVYTLFLPHFFPQHFFLPSLLMNYTIYALLLSHGYPYCMYQAVVYPTIDTFQNGLCLHPTWSQLTHVDQVGVCYCYLSWPSLSSSSCENYAIRWSVISLFVLS